MEMLKQLWDKTVEVVLTFLTVAFFGGVAVAFLLEWMEKTGATWSDIGKWSAIALIVMIVAWILLVLIIRVILDTLDQIDMDTVFKNIGVYIIIFIIVMVLNQALLFNGCSSGYCLLAAIPHVSFITLIIGSIIVFSNDDRGIR